MTDMVEHSEVDDDRETVFSFKTEEQSAATEGGEGLRSRQRRDNNESATAEAGGYENKTPRDIDSFISNDEEDEQESRKRSKSHSKDPINWFGILVPPTLRSSQKSFKKGKCFDTYMGGANTWSTANLLEWV